jgi:hypothetical protein
MAKEAERSRDEADRMIKEGITEILNNISRELNQRRFANSSEAVKWLLSNEFHEILETEEVIPQALRDLDTQKILADRIINAIAREVAGLAVETSTAFQQISPEGRKLLQVATLEQLQEIYQASRGQTTNKVGTDRINLFEKKQIIMDVSIIGEAPRQTERAGEILAGVTYEIGTPHEKIAMGITRLFNQIMAVGYKQNKPVVPAQLAGRFQEPLYVLPVGAPFQMAVSGQIKSNLTGLMMTDSRLVQQAEMGLPEFIRLVQWVLSAEYLKGKLEIRPNAPFPVMTSEVFNSLVNLINELALTNAAAQLIAKAA